MGAQKTRESAAARRKKCSSKAVRQRSSRATEIMENCWEGREKKRDVQTQEPLPPKNIVRCASYAHSPFPSFEV